MNNLSEVQKRCLIVFALLLPLLIVTIASGQIVELLAVFVFFSATASLIIAIVTIAQHADGDL